MYKVRQTWVDMFSARRLFVLDVKVNKIDPKWPITPLPPEENSSASGASAQSGTNQTQPPVKSNAQTVPTNATTGSSTNNFSNDSIAAKEEELRRLKERQLELQLEKQRRLVEAQKEEILRLDKAKELKQMLSSLLEQTKSKTLPESASKMLHDTFSSTLEVAQGLVTSQQPQPNPRDPRVRPESDDVLNQVVKDLKAGTKCLELPGDESQRKRQLNPKEPGPQMPKTPKQEDSGAEKMNDSDAEFKEACDEYKKLSDPRRAAQMKTKTSEPQPLEPVQPLKPPCSAHSLPVGPGPMPSSMSEIDHQRMVSEANEQFKNGELTKSQHGDLIDRLGKIYDIHKKLMNVTKAPLPPGETTAVSSSENASKVVTTTTNASKMSTSSSKSRPNQPPLLPTPISVEKAGDLLQPMAFPPTAHVVLNGEPFDLAIDGPPRTVMVAGKRRVLRINRQQRQVTMDGKAVYKLNTPIREILVDGCQVMIFYHGEMQSLWINSDEYRIRVDAPPQTITVDGTQIEIIVDTGAGQVIGKLHVHYLFFIHLFSFFFLIVNKEPVCSIANLPCDVVLPPRGNRYRFSFHAPARQIKIDGQDCEVKLDMPAPAVLINGQLRGICFQIHKQTLLVDGEPFDIYPDRSVPLNFAGATFDVRLGAPAQELIIGDHRYNIAFGNGPVFVMVNNRKFKLELPGKTPEVKVLGIMDPNTGQLLEPPYGPGVMPPPPHMPPMPPNFYPPMPPPPGFPHHPNPFIQPSTMTPTYSGDNSGSYAKPMQTNEPSITLPPIPVSVPSVPPPLVAPPSAPGGQVDVHDLLSKLMNKGLLPPPVSKPSQPPPLTNTTMNMADDAEAKKNKEIATPDLTDFYSDLLKGRYPNEITRLYAGVQCGACGCRFSSPDSTRYRTHLDWHYQINKKERDSVRVLRHRAWFLPVMVSVTFVFYFNQFCFIAFFVDLKIGLDSP